jgi:antitoxin YobK
MDFEEFDQLAERLRERDATIAVDGFRLIEARTASIGELAEAERSLGATLPTQYREFMLRYGGGMFGCVELLPVRAGTSRKDVDDVVSVSRHESPDGSFVAVAAVGTGDFWGFPVVDGRCLDGVWFYYHDGDDPTPESTDFLEFVARTGLRPLI